MIHVFDTIITAKKPTQIYYLTDLQVRRPKWVSWAKTKCGQAEFLSRRSRGDSVTCSFEWLAGFSSCECKATAQFSCWPWVEGCLLLEAGASPVSLPAPSKPAMVSGDILTLNLSDLFIYLPLLPLRTHGIGLKPPG